jgi:hypothetical protein
MNKRYIVRLTDEERKDLEEMTAKGRQAAYKISLRGHAAWMEGRRCI